MILKGLLIVNGNTDEFYLSMIEDGQRPNTTTFSLLLSSHLKKKEWKKDRCCFYSNEKE